MKFCLLGSVPLASMYWCSFASASMRSRSLHPVDICRPESLMIHRELSMTDPEESRRSGRSQSLIPNAFLGILIPSIHLHLNSKKCKKEQGGNAPPTHRNSRTKSERAETRPYENRRFSSNFIAVSPLITVWLQVRVLPGPPRKSRDWGPSALSIFRLRTNSRPETKKKPRHPEGQRGQVEETPKEGWPSFRPVNTSTPGVVSPKPGAGESQKSGSPSARRGCDGRSIKWRAARTTPSLESSSA